MVETLSLNRKNEATNKLGDRKTIKVLENMYNNNPDGGRLEQNRSNSGKRINLPSAQIKKANCNLTITSIVLLELL